MKDGSLPPRMARYGFFEHVVLRRCCRSHPPVARGLPRAVNNLFIQSLVAAFVANKAIADESSARAAITEVASE